MFNKRNLLACLLAGILMLSVTACGGNPAASQAPGANNAPSASTPAQGASTDATPAEAAPVTEKVGKTVLKCSFNQSIDNPEAQTMVDLSNKLFDATGGRYSIEVYPNELLGNQKDSLELVENGAIEMAIVANSLVENVNADFSVIGCPYMFDSIDHQKKLFQSGKLDELYATTENVGFTVLSAYSLGPRCIYTKDGPITTPEELAGKKIRVMQSDTMVQMVNHMGGVGTPMSQGDVYSAIQAGTLDGAENNVITYTDLKQYEVAPFYSETNHLMIPDLLIINVDVLKGMSAEDQKALKDLSTESVDVMFTLAANLRQEYRNTCKGLGVTFTEVDITPFQNNMQPLIDSVANRSDMSKAIYQEILNLR